LSSLPGLKLSQPFGGVARISCIADVPPSPMLSLLPPEIKRESLSLLRDYQKTRSTPIRNQLVQLNFGLVRREVQRWRHPANDGYDDLLQIGSLGLIRAIDYFDVSRGKAFSSFAVPFIRGEIQHYLRDKGFLVRIPRQWEALGHRAARMIRQLQVQLHRSPTDAEIAAALGITGSEWQSIKLAFRNRQPVSLDAIAGDDESRCTLGELLPDPTAASWQRSHEDQMQLQQALVQLEHRTREVVEFVFLYDLTQKDTAERLGISKVTVARQVKKGLECLRNLMISSNEWST
jgi:RNA polymerase sigma-B factor